MGQSHASEVIWDIHEDVKDGRDPQITHLEDLWTEACGGTNNNTINHRYEKTPTKTLRKIHNRKSIQYRISRRA